MKKTILLLLPDAKMHKLKIGTHVRSMREAPLTLASLAAMAPAEFEFNFVLIDGSIDPIPWEMNPDLVGISVMTGTANEAYRIADHFRQKGVIVVLGGVHTTLMPQEAAQHADSMVIGMADTAWKDLLTDFCHQKLKSCYDGTKSENDWLCDIPSPRLDLIRRSGYMVPDSVQATRGCSKKCDFCSVPPVWNRFQKRPIADIVRDIQKCRGPYLAFGDVNLIDDLTYARELFTALIPLKKKWGGLATTEILHEPELLELMGRSGCQFLLIGFESVNQPSLNQIAKGFNRSNDYKELVYRLHRAGISVQGCFVFGFDHDDTTVFSHTVQQVQELRIDIPRYSIYTPYPGTRLFSRLEAEQRILSYNWDDYDTMHVVFEPKNMSSNALYTGFKWAYRETFRMKHILQRTCGFHVSFPINLVGNITYRQFVKRLYRDRRFRSPYSIHHAAKNYHTERIRALRLCHT